MEAKKSCDIANECIMYCSSTVLPADGIFKELITADKMDGKNMERKEPRRLWEATNQNFWKEFCPRKVKLSFLHG